MEPNRHIGLQRNGDILIHARRKPKQQILHNSLHPIGHRSFRITLLANPHRNKIQHPLPRMHRVMDNDRAPIYYTPYSFLLGKSLTHRTWVLVSPSPQTKNILTNSKRNVHEKNGNTLTNVNLNKLRRKKTSTTFLGNKKPRNQNQRPIFNRRNKKGESIPRYFQNPYYPKRN